MKLQELVAAAAAYDVHHNPFENFESTTTVFRYMRGPVAFTVSNAYSNPVIHDADGNVMTSLAQVRAACHRTINNILHAAL